MSSLPKFVEEGLLKICKISEAPYEEVHKAFVELYNDDFVQKDPQFQSDQDRHEYSIQVLHTRYVARPPLKKFVIIPIGFTGLRIARSSGHPNCNIAVMVKGDKKIRRIVCRGEQSDQYRKISLFHQYTVNCGQFKSGDLIADNRTKFENPVRLDIKPADMMKKIGVKRILISDAAKFPSAQRKGQKKGRTFIDRSDWRCVRGVIVRDFRGEREDGTLYGCYTIADSSVSGDPTVLDDGTVIQPGFTVWTDPSHMVYNVEDQVDCYGTVNINKDGDPQMNGLLILPVHVRGGRQQ